MESYANTLSPLQQQMHKKAILALAFGIACAALQNPFGIAFGVLAIVFGSKSLSLAEQNRLTPDGRARVGRILGIVGIVVDTITTVRGIFRIVAMVTGLIGSIQSGSLGIVGDFFQELGQSLSNGL